MAKPLLIMLAGPNGAGKSTYFSSSLANLGLPFLNADILARESAMDSYTAASTIAKIRDGLIKRGEGFVTETVLSDPLGEKVGILEKAADSGFDVTLIYIGIESAELSRKRVRARTQVGGHDVPLEKILARYERTLDNLERAIDRLPRVLIYENSSFDSPYQLLGEFENSELVRRGNIAIPSWAERFFS